MTNETAILATTAASIAFFHTLLGPDHYVPFVMLARARRWSMLKTLLVTLFCGAGHVLSSIVLGLIGIVFAVAMFKLKALESMRGDFAAWMLIIFGFSYFAWSLHQLMRGKVHTHSHGKIAAHHHNHGHAHSLSKKETTSWTLFIIFVLGPCEPLIPLLMYPAARNSIFDVVLVTIVFSLITLSTMLAIVAVSVWGISRIRFGVLEKYVHTFSGLAIFLCGLAVKFLNL